MTKIVIDTNIFIGLYHSNNDTLAIFEDIRKLTPYLIVSDQLFDEFLRNRDINLQNLMINIQKAYTFNPHSSSLIKKMPQFEKVPKIKKELEKHAKDITIELKNMLENPDKDPIYSNFKKLFEYKRVTKLLRNDEIIEKAQIRKLIGNPPVSLDKNTIGDEILWELLISNISDDLILLTRDETFKNHITFLMTEFHGKTGKKLFIEEKISDAMKRFGKEASQETIKFETSYKLADDVVKAAFSSSAVSNSEAIQAAASPLSYYNQNIVNGAASLISGYTSEAIRASVSRATASPLSHYNQNVVSGAADMISGSLADAVQKVVSRATDPPLSYYNQNVVSGAASMISGFTTEAIRAGASRATAFPLPYNNQNVVSGAASMISGSTAEAIRAGAPRTPAFPLPCSNQNVVSGATDLFSRSTAELLKSGGTISPLAKKHKRP